MNSAGLSPIDVGVKRASTFTGFCRKHDAEFFKPIEVEPIQPTPRQCLLFGYRALCVEYLAKLHAKDAMRVAWRFAEEHLKDRPLWQAHAMEYAGDHRAGAILGIADGAALKSAFDEALQSPSLAPAKHYVIEIDKCPEIMCAGSTTPEVDFAGNLLQDLNPQAQVELICLSIVTIQSGGAIIFSWPDLGMLPNERLVQSLDRLPQKEKVHAALRFAFEHLENVYFHPPWWEGLSESDKSSIAARIPPRPKEAQHLLDDGVRVVDWQVCKTWSNRNLP